MASLKRPSWGPPDAASDFKRRKTEENHSTPPSRVLHVRNVSDGTREHDIIAAVRQFGKVSYVTLMPRVRQALLEFESLESAVNVVQYCKDNAIMLLGRPAFFNFSVSQNIKRAGQLDGQYHEYGPNKILLFTILNPMYPVSVSVLHTISTRCGCEVLRMAIFHKNGVQALVEFPDVEQATRCKEYLDGADIYAGCCTLKIEYSKADRVNVAVNNDESWDYTTTPSTGTPAATFPGRRPPLQPTPVNHPGAAGYGAATGSSVGHQPGQPFGFDAFGNQQHYPQYPTTGSFGEAFQSGNQSGFGQNQHPEPGAVLMVYGLDAARMNCDRLFNIMCAYGNVVRIKKLIKKPGCAMVQMEKRDGAFNALKWLHNFEFMGQTLQLSFSHHPTIEERGPANKFPDGSPAVVDYSTSRNNRFFSAEQSRKNLMIAPTRILHFFNAPSGITEEELIAVFTEAGTVPPTSIKLFDKKDPSARSTGLMEWNDASTALEAMALGNHVPLKAPNGQVFTLKLAFSLAATRGAGAEAPVHTNPSVVQTISVVPSMASYQPAVAQAAFPSAVGSFISDPYSTAAQ